MITRAFTGFPLRAIKNKYTNEYEKSDTKVHSVKSIQDGVWTLHGKDVEVDEKTGKPIKIVDSWGKVWNLSNVDVDRQAFVYGLCVGPIRHAGDVALLCEYNSVVKVWSFVIYKLMMVLLPTAIYLMPSSSKRT